MCACSLLQAPNPQQGGTAVNNDAAVFILSPGRTKSLDRASGVIAYMEAHEGVPVSVQEVADACDAYYEEVLHVLTTLEALDLVKRYSRDGSPREGPRVAYSWVQPTKRENMRDRAAFKARQRDRFPQAS